MFRRCRKSKAARRGGLSLLELLIALAIMVMVVGTLAGLSRAVQLSSEYSDGHGMATQHGRVALERITRTVNEATANEQFPGFLVLAGVQSGWRFPDTLVVWHPTGPPVDPEGLPRFNELVVYCPDPASPNQLLEITLPSNSSQAPAVGDASGWRATVEAFLDSTSSRKTALTGLMRTARVSEDGTSTLRGAVRFESRLRPSAVDWASYQAGTIAWKDLNWVQGVYGSQTGLRQAWLRIELQLMPGETAAANDPNGQQAIPLFGSAAIYYEMHR